MRGTALRTCPSAPYVLVQYVQYSRKIPNDADMRSTMDNITHSKAQKKKDQRRMAALTAPKHTYNHHAAAVELHEMAQQVDAGVKAGFDAALKKQKRLLEG